MPTPVIAVGAEAAGSQPVAGEPAAALRAGLTLCVASRLLVPVTLAAAATSGCATPTTERHPGAPSGPELQATRILDRHRARREFPGAVLAWRDPSGASVVVTAGTANAAQPDALIDPTAPWIPGSATETFVAVVMLQLAQEGKLDLDAAVERFFPDLPGASRITTRQLLQHTSGLAGRRLPLRERELPGTRRDRREGDLPPLGRRGSTPDPQAA